MTETVLGRAGRCKRRLGGKVRLADKRGGVAGLRERTRKAGFADRRIEVDTVVPDPVRERQLAGQY